MQRQAAKSQGSIVSALHCVSTKDELTFDPITPVFTSIHTCLEKKKKRKKKRSFGAILSIVCVLGITIGLHGNRKVCIICPYRCLDRNSLSISILQLLWTV